MAYTPTEWENGELLAANKFNKMEAGIRSANSSYVPTEWTPGDVITAEALNKIENGIAAAGGGGGGNSGIEADYRGLSYAFLDYSGNLRHSTTKNYYLNAFPVEGGKEYLIVPPSLNISHNRFRIAFFYGKSFADFENYINTPATQETTIYAPDAFSTRDSLSNESYTKTSEQDGELIVITDNQSVIAPAYCVEAVNTN